MPWSKNIGVSVWTNSFANMESWKDLSHISLSHSDMHPKKDFNLEKVSSGPCNTVDETNIKPKGLCAVPVQRCFATAAAMALSAVATVPNCP